MEEKITYEKVYFDDEYKNQIAELRDQYRNRTQLAISGTASTKKATPNVDSVVFLRDNDDGDGVCVTTGDFIDFFNRRYGNNDRLGAMRRSLALAEQRAGKRNELAKRQKPEGIKEKEKEKPGFVNRVRTAGRRLILVPTVLATILVLTVALIVVCVPTDYRGDDIVPPAGTQVTLPATDPAGNAGTTTEQTAVATETVFEAAERKGGVIMAALLNTLAALGGK